MNVHSFCGMLFRKKGVEMLLRPKTSLQIDAVQNVHLAKGTVKLGTYQLNVYCFITDGLLIDTGSRSLARNLKPFFREQDLDQVVITHHHEDHTGNAGYLQRKYGLPIFMRTELIALCREKADYPLYRQIFWGRREPFLAEPIPDTLMSRKFSWEVIHTPGHAVDHIALFNKDTGQLFTGDLYCGERTRIILREESIATIIESIKKVLSYDFTDVYCSHLGYVKDGRNALERKLTYLQGLQGKILNFYQEGKTIKEITKLVFPKKYPIEWISLGEWSAENIVRSVINDSI